LVSRGYFFRNADRIDTLEGKNLKVIAEKDINRKDLKRGIEKKAEPLLIDS
jgi:hypothetical protein